MGYTHYWKIHKDCPPNLYKQALDDCRQIVKKCTKEYHLCNSGGDSGTKPDLNNKIAFNGFEDESHETFFLESKVLQRPESYIKENDPWIFNFCKTARKEYDSVVMACLVVLKDILESNVIVSSDGDSDDWNCGVELACKILNRKLKNPIK